MELADCNCKCIAPTCYSGPDGSEILTFKEEINSYEDYLNNLKYCESKKKTLEEDFRYYQKREQDNKKQLKNLFLGEFINTDKKINGLCIHETKDIEKPYYHTYLYIVDFNKHNIGEDGIYVNCIRIEYRENDGVMSKVSIRQEDSYYITYEKLCSCQITNGEFMNLYNLTHFQIITDLGLNKVNDNC